MKVTTVTMGLVIALAAIVSAQNASSDEQHIRELIAKYDSGERLSAMGTNDRIFWSSIYKRPSVSPAQGEEVPDLRAPISERKPGSQRNQATPSVIEVAKSGDMAYEVSDHIISFEMKDGSKRSVPASLDASVAEGRRPVEDCGTVLISALLRADQALITVPVSGSYSRTHRRLNSPSSARVEGTCADVFGVCDSRTSLSPRRVTPSRHRKRYSIKSSWTFLV
jgi:hypothetical protein